jgi:hypothetical protein
VPCPVTASYQGATEKKKVCETELKRYQLFYQQMVTDVSVLKKRLLGAVQAKYVFVNYQLTHLEQERHKQESKVESIAYRKRQLQEQESRNPTLALKRAKISQATATAAASDVDVASRWRDPMDLGF